MNNKSQLILMAEYNKVMNQRICDSSHNLSQSVLNEDKGAFFKSIFATLNHIMIGDILWLKRFSKHPNHYTSLNEMNTFVQAQSLDQILFNHMSSFIKERNRLDNIIINFCNELNTSDVDTSLTYINFKNEKHCKNFGALILHVFLHQAHHRGQITTLLSQENINFGDTDLPEFIPDELHT